MYYDRSTFSETEKRLRGNMDSDRHAYTLKRMLDIALRKPTWLSVESDEPNSHKYNYFVKGILAGSVTISLETGLVHGELISGSVTARSTEPIGQFEHLEPAVSTLETIIYSRSEASSN